jgi:SAM-dependent methyltransferase
VHGYGPATYGRYIADYYDEHHAQFPWCDPTEPVDFLVERLAGRGPALELGVGTGRVAVPLALRGVEVHGVDASAEMVEQMRAKPGGEDVHVFFGNMADVPADGSYPLVYVPFNTFFALTTQAEQVRCFRNVESHLTDDGVFVVEATVPNPSRFVGGRQHIGIWGMTPESVDLEITAYDAIEQRLTTQHVRLTNEGVRVMPRVFREVWPSELDLMAEVAGLRLLERWSDWARAPFGPGSVNHVSVYGR